MVYSFRIVHTGNEAGTITAVITQAIYIERVSTRDAVVDLEVDRLSYIDTDLSGETLNLRITLIVDRSVDGPGTLRASLPSGFLVLLDWSSSVGLVTTINSPHG